MRGFLQARETCSDTTFDALGPRGASSWARLRQLGRLLSLQPASSENERPSEPLGFGPARLAGRIWAKVQLDRLVSAGKRRAAPLFLRASGNAQGRSARGGPRGGRRGGAACERTANARTAGSRAQSAGWAGRFRVPQTMGAPWRWRVAECWSVAFCAFGANKSADFRPTGATSNQLSFHIVGPKADTLSPAAQWTKMPRNN